MRFTKAQTNGNDFVIIDGNVFNPNLMKLISDRKFGIGCDQIIVPSKISEEKYEVKFFNQDGSGALMCGNGASAVSKYIKKSLTYPTDEIELIISGDSYKSSISSLTDEVSLEFQKPNRLSENIISTGNKHLICNMELINSVDKLKNDYPDCNIHFIEKKSENSIGVKTFERGVGWTLACGSGAIAVGFHSEISEEITIIHDGGISKVTIKDDSALLKTNPKLVFEGTLYE